jgi:hypothetical protein
MDPQERLKEKAYQLGFSVGYYKHMETGWVLKELEKLKRKGRELNVDVMIYYEQGKRDGERERRFFLEEEKRKSETKSHLEFLDIPKVIKLESYFPKILNIPSFLVNFFLRR